VRESESGRGRPDQTAEQVLYTRERERERERESESESESKRARERESGQERERGGGPIRLPSRCARSLSRLTPQENNLKVVSCLPDSQKFDE